MVNPDGVTFLDGKERLKLVDTLTNHAVLSGTSSQGTSSGSDYEMKVQNSSASVKLSGVSLYKVDSSNYGKRLQGATFRLEKWVWNNAEKTGSWETVLDRVTSDENGLLKTVGSDNRNLLQTGVAYRMVELEAPHGYELRMEPFDFYIDTEPANTPKDYAGQLCFTGQRVFIPNTRGYYDPQLTKNILESGSPVKRNTAKPGETVQFQTASSELPASPDDSLRPGAPGPDNQDGWVLGAHGAAGNPAAEAPADSTAAAPMPDNHKNKVMGAVDSLIQTGQLNWPIPVLLTLGGALVLAGLVLTRRKNRR